MNVALQRTLGVSLTWRMIVAAFRPNEVPVEMRSLIADLEAFRTQQV
ncbi:MAG: hypothetical protein ACLQHS_09875 [Candidatus Limnocylindrales bacterium]